MIQELCVCFISNQIVRIQPLDISKVPGLGDLSYVLSIRVGDSIRPARNS